MEQPGMSTIRVLESGMALDLPADAWFRFADMAAYKPLSGDAIKEMDYGYFNEAVRSIDLVELKSYTRADRPQKLGEILPELITKGRDSILLLQAAWRGLGPGLNIAERLPQSCRSNARLRLYFVVKPAETQREQFSRISLLDLQGRLRKCLATYAQLLGVEVRIEDVFLFDENKGMEKLPLTVVDSSS